MRISLLNKKGVILLLGILFSLNAVVQGQDNSDLDITSVHPIVGDTIDKIEKVKYDLFPEISYFNYAYALYITKGNEMFLRVFHADSSFFDRPYNIELLSVDRDKIVQNKDRVFKEPVAEHRNVILKITDQQKSKSIRLRKRKVIQYTCSGTEETAKIKNIIVSDDPVLRLKHAGKIKILKLSEIDIIYQRTLVDQVSIYLITSTMAIIGSGGMISNANNTGLNISLLTIGVVGFLIKNNKIVPQNSEIEVIYK